MDRKSWITKTGDLVMITGRKSTDNTKVSELKAKINPGSIIRIHCDFIENPKIKYIVFAYIDFETNDSLVFIINSQIPAFIEHDQHLKAGQIPLKKTDYPFFENECSFLDCIQVFNGLDLDFMVSYLLKNPGEYKGELLSAEIEMVIAFVDKAQTLSQDDKYTIIKSIG